MAGASKPAERERLAREMHDTLLQGLQGLILQFQAAVARMPGPNAASLPLNHALDRAEQLLVASRDRAQEFDRVARRDALLGASAVKIAPETRQNPLAPFTPAGPTMQQIQILTVDDHPLLREGIAAVIEGQPDMRLVGEAANGQEAIAAFREHRPDVTLMDLRMPDMSGIEAISAIRAEFPDARIIVLTMYKGDVHALGALKAGASAYLLKSMLRKDLLETIRTVHAGKRRIPPEIASEIAEHATDDALTEREIEVLQQVGAGHSNKQIAQQLTISEGTVKAHMKSILPKLGARDRTHAVMIAVKRGILDV